MKMFCFCHAGGMSTYYSFLKPQSLKGIDEVYLFEYPGRGRKCKKEGYKSFDECVEDVCKQIVKANVKTKEFVLFGHSMGAFVAYETACRLQKEYNLYPYHVFISGQKPPIRVVKGHYENCEKHGMEFLKELGGVPDIILENDEIAKYFLDICIKDLRVLQSYVPHKAFEENLPAYGSIICGDHDAEVSVEELKDWKPYFKNKPTIKVVEGSHFYLHDKQKDLISFINNELELGCV